MANDQGPLASPNIQGAQDPLPPQDPPPTQNPPLPPEPQVSHVPQALQVPQQPIPHMPPLNWSHFKPNFSRKPDKDAKAQLLRTDNWLTHTDFRTTTKYRDSV